MRDSQRDLIHDQKFEFDDDDYEFLFFFFFFLTFFPLFSLLFLCLFYNTWSRSGFRDIPHTSLLMLQRWICL